MFFVLLLMEYAAPRIALVIVTYFSLTPGFAAPRLVVATGNLQLLNTGVLHVAFNMLTLWFIRLFS